LGAQTGVAPLNKKHVSPPGSSINKALISNATIMPCLQMKENAFKRLTFVNAILIKYNILSGLENLGLADCNKYLVSLYFGINQSINQSIK
jgi:hypothetical protein